MFVGISNASASMPSIYDTSIVPGVKMNLKRMISKNGKEMIRREGKKNSLDGSRA